MCRSRCARAERHVSARHTLLHERSFAGAADRIYPLRLRHLLLGESTMRPVGHIHTTRTFSAFFRGIAVLLSTCSVGAVIFAAFTTAAGIVA